MDFLEKILKLVLVIFIGVVIFFIFSIVGGVLSAVE